MTDILGYLSVHSESIGHIFGALQSFATVVALIVAGVWTFRLFVKNRLGKPRAKISHEVVVRDLDDSCLLIHVAIKVRNQSAILMKIASGEVRLVPMLPLSSDLAAVLKDKTNPLRPGEAEIFWMGRKTIEWDWSREPREIEPQEEDTFHFDFIVAKPLRTFQIYSYFDNLAKAGQRIGWNTTSIHDYSVTGGED